LAAGAFPIILSRGVLGGLVSFKKFDIVRVYLYFIKQIWKIIIFSKMVKITFKSPTQTEPFTLDIDLSTVTTVIKLKEEVGKKTNDPAANIKLIHKGR
jgi:hypothetical protein